MKREVVNAMLSSLVGVQLINVTSTDYAYVFRDEVTSKHYVCSKQGNLMSCDQVYYMAYKYNNKILILLNVKNGGERFLTVFDTELDAELYRDIKIGQFYDKAGVIRTDEGKILLLDENGKVCAEGEVEGGLVRVGKFFVINSKKYDTQLKRGLSKTPSESWEGTVVVLNNKLEVEKKYPEYCLSTWYATQAILENIETGKQNIVKQDGNLLTNKDNTHISWYGKSKHKDIVVINYYKDPCVNSLKLSDVNSFIESIRRGNRPDGKIVYSVYSDTFSFKQEFVIPLSFAIKYDTVFFIGKYVGFRNTPNKLYHFYELDSSNKLKFSMSASYEKYYASSNYQTTSHSIAHGNSVFEFIRNLIVVKEGKKGVIDENGNFILEPIYDTVRQIEQCKRVYVVIKDGLKSVLDCKKGVFYDLKATDITGVKDYTIYYRCGYVDKQLDLKKQVKYDV